MRGIVSAERGERLRKTLEFLLQISRRVEEEHYRLRNAERTPKLIADFCPEASDAVIQHGVVVSALATRASTTVEAIIVLSDQAYGTDALVLARSLMETCTNLVWILQDAYTRAHLYGLRLAKQRSDIYGILQKHYPETYKEGYATLSTERSIAERLFPDRMKWARSTGSEELGTLMSFKELLADAHRGEVGHEIRYDLEYNLLSAETHSVPLAVLGLAEAISEAGKITASPRKDEQGAIDVLFHASISFWWALFWLDRYLNLGADEQLAEAWAEIAKPDEARPVLGSIAVV